MQIEEIKDQICDVCHKMWQLGWVAANDGNVSVRLEDGTFLATPTGMSKSFITPDKLLRIDAKGNVLEGAEGLRPSSEIKMHLRCYEKRADVNAVVHAHPPAATGFAVAHRPMDMYNMIEDVAAIGAVPLTPYGTPSTTEVPDAIEPYLNDHDVMLLENHGALTVGSDVITAYYRMESLELWAKITINAIILGGSYDIDRKNIDKLINLRSYYKITGKHPGYRKFERREKRRADGQIRRHRMLKNIPPILSPELLKVLCEMGHGDEIILADGNFPAESIGKDAIVIRADGHGTVELLEAILQFLPLDQYVEKPVALMKVVDGDPCKPTIWDSYKQKLNESGNDPAKIEMMERFAFYERARHAYAIIATGESAIYANVLLKKGVVQ